VFHAQNLGTGSEYRTRGTRKLDRDVALDSIQAEITSAQESDRLRRRRARMLRSGGEP
jgi:hypothetical protein